jgi:hypothetical protein
MEEIISGIANYGIGFACLIYVIYSENTAMKEMTKIMNKMNETLNGINTRLTIIEDKLERKEN